MLESDHWRKWPDRGACIVHLGSHTLNLQGSPCEEFRLSVAFTKEESAETASETLLPDRPISPHPNLVTGTGLKTLERQLREAREAYEAAHGIEDVNDRRREAAIPLRDLRYYSERVRTAQLVPDPTSSRSLPLAAR